MTAPSAPDLPCDPAVDVSVDFDTSLPHFFDGEFSAGSSMEPPGDASAPINLDAPLDGSDSAGEPWLNQTYSMQVYACVFYLYVSTEFISFQDATLMPPAEKEPAASPAPTPEEAPSPDPADGQSLNSEPQPIPSSAPVVCEEPRLMQAYSLVNDMVEPPPLPAPGGEASAAPPDPLTGIPQPPEGAPPSSPDLSAWADWAAAGSRRSEGTANVVPSPPSSSLPSDSFGRLAVEPPPLAASFGLLASPSGGVGGAGDRWDAQPWRSPGLLFLPLLSPLIGHPLPD